MSYISNTSAFNTTTVVAVEATDYITAARTNGYYEQLLSNEQRLKDTSDLRDRIVYVELKASDWVGTSKPYSQTLTTDKDGVALPFAATDKPTMISNLSSSASESAQKSYAKAYGILGSGSGTVGAGTATFYIWKAITTDITVGLRGC